MTGLPATFERRRLPGRAAQAVVAAKQDRDHVPDRSAPNPNHGKCPRCREPRAKGLVCTTPGCRTLVPR